MDGLRIARFTISSSRVRLLCARLVNSWTQHLTSSLPTPFRPGVSEVNTPNGVLPAIGIRSQNPFDATRRLRRSFTRRHSTDPFSQTISPTASRRKTNAVHRRRTAKMLPLRHNRFWSERTAQGFSLASALGMRRDNMRPESSARGECSGYRALMQRSL